MKVIVTGATGMVGEGVLHTCLNHPEVEAVLVIGRRSCNVQHPKLKEIVHKNFHDLSSVAEQLSGYDACFFCLGVSSVGMKEPVYYHLTYKLTTHVAETLVKQNKAMTFCYVSGAGTDSSEKGRLMWARVKGKTENDLMKLPFKAVYNFRPEIIEAGKDMQFTNKWYKYFVWLLWIIKKISPNSITTLEQIGKAMINVTKSGYEKHVLEIKDIHIAAAQ